VADHDLARTDPRRHPQADQGDRDRVAVLPDRHQRLRIHARRCLLGRLVLLEGQLAERPRLHSERLTDRLVAAGDPPREVGEASVLEQVVELLERAHLRNGDEMVAAEAADLALHAALLMGALLAAAGEDRLVQVVRAQADEAVRVVTGDYACLLRGKQEVACGIVTKATLKGAVILFDAKKEPIKLGDKFALGKKTRPLSHARSTASTLERGVEMARQPKPYTIDLTGGAYVSPAYIIPLIHIQAGVAKNVALGIQGGYTGDSVEDLKLTGLALLATVNFYHLGSFKGFWAQVGGGLYLFTVTGPSISEKVSSLAALGTVGYRANLSSGINIGAGVGGQYIKSPETQSVSFDYSQVQPVAVIDVGISF